MVTIRLQSGCESMKIFWVMTPHCPVNNPTHYFDIQLRNKERFCSDMACKQERN